MVIYLLCESAGDGPQAAEASGKDVGDAVGVKERDTDLRDIADDDMSV
jgi:hypothetical protein